MSALRKIKDMKDAVNGFVDNNLPMVLTFICIFGVVVIATIENPLISKVNKDGHTYVVNRRGGVIHCLDCQCFLLEENPHK
jgi:hypothetical protein